MLEIHKFLWDKLLKEFCKIILIKIIKYNKINKKYIKYSFNFFLMLKLVSYEYNEYKFQKLFKIE